MNPFNPNARMPLSWMASGHTMTFCDSGRCCFFKHIHALLCCLNSLAGVDMSGGDEGECHLLRSPLVKLKLELKKDRLRFYARDFGVFSRVDNSIPYGEFFSLYTMFRDVPGLPDGGRWVLCRAFEVIINAVERMAPGLFLRLVEHGLPPGFSFEEWDGEFIIPGQILRHLPSDDTGKILAWTKTPDFLVTAGKIIEEVDKRWEGVELAN